MEFISSNVLKGIVVDKGRIVSAYLQNKITGNKINQGACECGVSYFVKTGILTKKAYFDSSQMEVKNTFEDGLELQAQHGGMTWNIIVKYAADEKSGVLRKTLTLKVSDTNVNIDYILLDGFSTEGVKFSWSIPKEIGRAHV